MLPLLLATFVALFSSGEAYKCYICSWSPRDVNRTDNCTHENFNSKNVPSDYCELGCEIFVQRDKNGVLDQWRRNCLQKGTNLTGDCVREETKAVAKQRCTCARDYCNKASSSLKWSGQGQALAFLLVLTGASSPWWRRV